jgi:nitrogen fixation NifU-like protein
MDDLYQEELLDHYHNPHNYGDMVDPTCTVIETNASCGDKLSLDLKVEKHDDDYVVIDARFTGIGCAVSIASTSLLTDYIKNKTVLELKAIDFDFMQKLLGTTISPGRVKCLTLSARALMNALNLALEKIS